VLHECIYFMIIMEHIGTSKVKFKINVDPNEVLPVSLHVSSPKQLNKFR